MRRSRSILSVRIHRVLLAAMGAASVMSGGIALAADVPAEPSEDAAAAGSPPAPQAAADTGGLAEVQGKLGRVREPPAWLVADGCDILDVHHRPPGGETVDVDQPGLDAQALVHRDVGAQGLLAKIGSRVNDDILAVARKEQGRAQAVVVRVWRGADGTVASERWNAHGRAGAEYGDF